MVYLLFYLLDRVSWPIVKFSCNVNF